MIPIQQSARRVQFHPEKQIDFVWRHGQRVIYMKSYRCSCFDGDSKNRKIDCPYCDVDGYRYECSIPTRAIITGIQDKMGFTQAGTLKQGDCVGGFPWTLPIAFHDKVILMNKKVREEALLVNDSEYPPMLKDYEICQLMNAHTLTRTFVGHRDYRLAADGKTIEWLTANPPADMEKFTVQFMIRPIYIVWQVMPLERHSEDKNMPKHVILRRKDDFGGLGRDRVGGL